MDIRILDPNQSRFNGNCSGQKTSKNLIGSKCQGLSFFYNKKTRMPKPNSTDRLDLVNRHVRGKGKLTFISDLQPPQISIDK